MDKKLTDVPENNVGKMTDNEIKKNLEIYIKDIRCVKCDFEDECLFDVIKSALDLINRLQAENKKLKDRQKPTGASGYKIENGKVVFFTNMLGGCKIVKENLEEVVKTLNELLQECYSKDEIAFALKCKTEELETAKAEVDHWKRNAFDGCMERSRIEKTAKAEAYKECIEKVKEELSLIRRECRNVLDNDGVFAIDRARKKVDNLLKEMEGK